MSGGASPPNWITMLTMGPLVAAHQRETERAAENTAQDTAATNAQIAADYSASAKAGADKAAAAQKAEAEAAAKAAAEAADAAQNEATLARRRRGSSSVKTSAQGVLGQASVTAKTLLGQ